jgi:hypothetical protein
MSVSVSLQELWDRVAEFGDMAFLITSGTDGKPHVVSVNISVASAGEGDALEVNAGKTSRANAESNPAVSLLWSPLPGGDYSLIVDGVASPTAAGDGLTIDPGRAVLHRIASATNDVPSCVTIIPGD